MNYWRLTDKRRGNLAKICLALLTVDVGGLIVPFFTLPTLGFRVSLFIGGFVGAAVLIFLVYAIER